MNLTTEKLLKGFFYISAGIFFLGAAYNIVNNAFDIYQAWLILVLVIAIYLIENKSNK
jgi:hypothetical protein